MKIPFTTHSVDLADLELFYFYLFHKPVIQNL